MNSMKSVFRMTGIASAAACAQVMAQDLRAVTTPVPKNYDYQLSITSVQAGPLLENQPIEVHYELAVKASGVSGTSPPPRQGKICGADQGNCVSVGLLSVGRRVLGKITTTAQAGAAAPLRIVLTGPKSCTLGTPCFGTEVLAQASATRPVAARYSVTLDRFEIQHTRAPHNDTLVAYLQGAVDGQISAIPLEQCKVYGPRYCASAALGDFNNGSSPKSWPIAGVRVGSYDIVPEQDGDLKVHYWLLNAGNNGLIPDCDGPVYVGSKLLPNRAIGAAVDVTLDALTRANGQLHVEEPLQVHKSQDGCGASSEYRVWWSVHRDSWRLPKQFRLSHSTLSL